MSKRLTMIGALCISLMALWSIDAHAWPTSSTGTASDGGWGATQKCLTVWSGWKGIANAELRPTSVKVVIYPHEVLVMFKNHGGNDGGVGVPFSFPTTVSATQVSPQKAIKNGRWNSYITFYDEDLLALIPPEELEAMASKLKNGNWTAYAVVVKTFDVMIQAFDDVNSTCSTESDICYTTNCTYDSNTDQTTCGTPFTAEEVVHIQGFCDLKSAPINVGSDYTCSNTGPGPSPDYKQWEYSNAYSTCLSQYPSTCLYLW